MKKLLLAVLGFSLFCGAALWAQSPGVNSPFNPVWSIPLDSIKRTYTITAQNLSPNSGGTATDVFQLCGGTNVVTRVVRVTVAGRATAQAPADIYLMRRSAQNTAGTVAAIFPLLSATAGLPMDTSTSASTSSVYAWSGPPTLGTLVNVVAVGQLYLGNLTTGTSSPLVFDHGVRPSQAIVLRGAAQCLSVNLSGGSFGGNTFDIYAEWTEE